MRGLLLQLVVAVSCLLVGGARIVHAPHLPFEVGTARAAQSYTARGVVQSLAKDRSSITIAHEAIPGFMPAMAMSFESRSPEQLAAFHEKDHVSFSFTVTDDARRLIDSIRLAPTAH